MRKALLLSVRDEYATKIFDGVKTVELRRCKPKLDKNDYLIIYVPSPIKCIIGVACVAHVVRATVGVLWREVRDSCQLSYAEYQRYFRDSVAGYGIFLTRPGRLDRPISLDTLRELKPRFTPQGYQYFTRYDLADALIRLRLSQNDKDRNLGQVGRNSRVSPN